MPTHPHLDHLGNKVPIGHPHQPSPLGSWEDPCQVATVVPRGPMPNRLNHVLVRPWKPAPTCAKAWETMSWDEEMADLEGEPSFDAQGLQAAAGAVVVEPDGRVWLVAPTNAFGGAQFAFPKGHTDTFGLRTTAIKEVYEESGLRVEILSHLVDVTRSTTRTRYYLARRTGGTPADMGWESQAVLLAPLEDLGTLLTQAVDHQIVDALLERMGEWASWFAQHKPAPDLAQAKQGLVPARRIHRPTLPMPRTRTTLTLNLHLTRTEAERLRLGFIPSAMEEKWFAYMDGDTLFEHRSWTGYCISQVHFVPEGDGLRATHAEVNRFPGQYSNQDDEEDRQSITARVSGLAALEPGTRHAEDSFVTALKASLAPNYLGDPEVVTKLLTPFFQAVIDLHVTLAQPRQGAVSVAYKEFLRTNTLVARAFAGEDAAYPTIGTWNTPASLGAEAIQGLDLDPSYHAEENLFCILSEGLAGVSMKVAEILKAYDQDPQAELDRDLLPNLGKVRDFVISLLMGTRCVAFPGRTLKDFTYTPAKEA